MIRTVDVKHVPVTWIFEHYCKLKERLHGQDVKIKSLFNPHERTPSMCIYLSPDSVYKFNDFSSGNKGSGVELVMMLYDIPYQVACDRILDDYEARSDGDYEEVDIEPESKFQVTSFKRRQWNENDAKFWTQFGIGSRILSKYNVIPLENYVMSKDTKEGVVEFTVSGQGLYGYLTDNGEIYKIYRPKKSEYKFFTLSPHIQGSDQLTYSKPTLIICSSLKDMMTLDAMCFDVEAVAPSSENTMLPRSVLSAYALKYEKIMTLFDNDTAGHNAMDKYKSTYGIPGIYLNLSKDLSDSVRDFGLAETRQYLKPLLI